MAGTEKRKILDPVVKHFAQLVGKTVKSIALDYTDPAEPCYGLVFTDGTVAWALCDQEGNGPGWLGIEKG